TAVQWQKPSCQKSFPGGASREKSQMRDKCLTEYGGYIELHYTYATTQTFSFDLCNVIDCKGYNESWRDYDVYLCIFGRGVPGYQKWCPSWSFVWWHSRPGYWGEQTKSTEGKMKSKNIGTPLSRRPNFPGPCHDSKEDSFYLIIGVYQAGADTMATIKVRLHYALSPNHSMTTVWPALEPAPHCSLCLPLYCSGRTGQDLIACCNDCTVLSTPPPVFSPMTRNYTCLTRVNATPVGAPDDSWYDLFWWCGDKVLRDTMPSSWSGTCTTVRLALPIVLAGSHASAEDHVGRARRTTTEDFDLTKNSPTYIDAIGIPRGVPDEFKLANQVSGGFESIFLWVTPNKNVDRINYVHYNLAAVSLMAWQNRMALDIPLCCTFIPNNTAPDGTVTRALEGLRTLSSQMTEDSSITSPLDGWFNRQFGKYKAIVMSFCCLIPCLRTILSRLITVALTKESESPKLQLPLLQTEDYIDDSESEDDCDE
uniref:Uncharacterized protein n=1 Tax=Neolamprologus brichardi TaxID=32507 RepID=A0A3Q4I9F2_NEOBR